MENLMARRWVFTKISPVYILIGCFVLFSAAIYAYMGSRFEWDDAFRPAALALIHGQSPYSVPTFLNAPWLLIPILPLALLPERLGSALFISIGFFSIAYCGIKLGAKPIGLVFLLLSHPVLQIMWRGQIDWLSALGFVLPPPIGIFLVIAKPQIGFMIIPFWAWEYWKKGKWIGLIKLFLPVGLGFMGSFLLFGLWPLRGGQVFEGLVNTSLFPQSIPIGLVLAVLAFRIKKRQLSIAASPFLSPYVPGYSWIGVFLGLMPFTTEFIAAVVGYWVWVLVNYFHII